MKILESKIVAELPPSEGNPRNSEGSFIRLDDGRIAFAYSRYIGTSWLDHAECEIACVYSDDNGETFDTEHPETIVKASDHGQTNVMSVTLRRMNNGDIGLFYLLKIEEGGLHSQYYLRRYRGDFSNKVGEVKVGPDRFPAYYVINNDRVVHLSSGRWIVPAAHHPTPLCPQETNNPKWCDSRSTVYIFASDDDGFTWTTTNAKLDLVDPYTKSGFQEPGAVELPGGAVYGYLRTDRMYQYESVSLDGGDNFTPPRPSKFTSPRSPMLIKKNPYTGRYYAVWNPVPNYPGRTFPKDFFQEGRTPLVIADSENGTDFSAFEILEGDENRGFCYPAIEFLDEKTMLISYCSGGKEDVACLNRTTIRKITVE